MTIYDTIGTCYVVFATVAFTVFLGGCLIIGASELRRRYWRGKNMEFQDIVEQHRLREMMRNGQ
jgi:hypothetical protein